ncbi:Alpha-amylase {ECO:0000269/PubMed:11997021, ECO:0000269/PubMed:12915728, ECO:0000269/PubMed:14632998}; AltName: Full=1,4-alpha-D-glucan glucanohydrolase; AltName: Full=BLA; Flags: Precursor [Serendipita indica DSM 11827]|nr:Alpha-amylase {ECO:0000269/PubMed:11997021, ECO:0000269/PubMed:12915728, ECO:0000269/PubMed:14632998}; AltName: Full=1,4-alpha-D-glucan glucanohydrolase; AltName: Full=BLA; Flags: Precursor [Serendipita indica DSM 11827]
MAHHANAEYTDRKRDENFTLLQAFEWYTKGGGKHWKKFNEISKELSLAGITAYWISPPTKAANPSSVGYDIYDLWDLGEFDQKGGAATKYGTKDDLVAMINEARRNGIVVYIDAVLNHKFGADDVEKFRASAVDSNDRTQDVGEQHNIKGWTGFSFPGRQGKYSELNWCFNHFTGVDYDDKSKETTIFRIQGDGKTWAAHVDGENQNYDFLMGQILTTKVEKDMLDWGTWVLKEVDPFEFETSHGTDEKIKTGAQGFRFDAIKHISRDFIAKFVQHVRETSGSSHMFAVGEYWKDSIDDLDTYLSELGTQFSVFDTPLHYNFKKAGEQGSSYDMRQIFDGTVVQKRPIDAVTLVDNHDTQVGQSLESCVPSWFKPLAYALILYRPDGYPCVFWGDLYGCEGPEGNPQPPVSQLADFVRARKLFAYGEIRDYWDHPNCLGWVRVGDEWHDGCAIVMCNGDEGFKWMEVGKEHAGETWTDVLGWHQGEVKINEDGWGEFKCPARSVGVWTRQDARGREEFSTCK